MNHLNHILIYDRNPNVREFLRRELTRSGYQVQTAKNGRELLKSLLQQNDIDLVVMDLDLPDMDQAGVMEKLKNRIPIVPVVIHSFKKDLEIKPPVFSRVVFVEKSAKSIEQLIAVIHQLLGVRSTKNKECK